ncbi:DUF5988 family protein [Streptomyces coelicoflavus]|uniref:DUF5988 family protein n=1 Tax=Streptomyces coelicoflavus TaxID=285562 RepID=UPI0002475AC8|nr:hypothetical protein SMCF_5668 [Streptomyces coelicoflavus ZG0656]MZE49509.1 hypothetical protein [Streptomyces sp. SID5477]
MTSTILTTAQVHSNNILRSGGDRAAEPNIFLAGGKDIPEDQRMHEVEPLTDRVKLNVENRYEHFEATSEVREVDGRSLRVYGWIYRTYVAE